MTNEAYRPIFILSRGKADYEAGTNHDKWAKNRGRIYRSGHFSGPWDSHLLFWGHLGRRLRGVHEGPAEARTNIVLRGLRIDGLEVKMKHVASASTRSVIIIRWLARIIGTLSVAILSFLFVAESVEKGGIAIDSDRIPMTAFMFLAFIGLIMAWRWEGLGGAMALGSLIAFNMFAPASPFKGGLLVVTGLYGLPALLFIFCWWRTRKTA